MSRRVFRVPNSLALGLCSAVLALGFAGRVAAQAWTNKALPPEERADALLAQMTIDEKIAMVHGTNGSYVGNIAANTRLGIPAIAFDDGPAGVGQGANNVTAWPAPIALGATWDVDLARQYGDALGAEARGKGVTVLLGPMMNMARVYRAGRNFEGSGEDPYLSAAIASAEIQGMQGAGMIGCAKHYVCNEQETDRLRCSSDLDERTLHEVYGPPFRASAAAGVGTVMAAYNRVNTRFACETETMNAVLRKLWAFDGFIMSDWGAHFSAAGGADNGLDVEMPSNVRFGDTLKAAVQTGLVPAAELDGMVHRILTTLFRFAVFDDPTNGNLGSNVMSTAHNQLARDIAAQGTVLCKNRAGLLPLAVGSVDSIAVLGSAASVSPIPVGCGSAAVVLPYHVTPLDGISNRVGGGISITYNRGDGGHIAEAVQLAATSDVAVVCVGQQTCEGWDRSTLSLPDDQDALVAAVAATNTNTIVVIYTSASMLMPWVDDVAAVLVAWYPGQENGNALADVLSGDVDASGRLPMTFPASGTEVPANTTSQFPGAKSHVAYSERLLIGHRWYDANAVAPLFPLGHGLSYATFGYSNLNVGAVSTAGQVEISFDLTNTGARAGTATPQLYLGFPDADGEPPKVLKGFQKVALAAGEGRQVTFPLTWEDLAHWDETARGWVVTPGTFDVMVGPSAGDISLTGTLTVAAQVPSGDPANAALHKPATNSSTAATNYPAGSAVDGNTETAWTSLASDPQWIMVDLRLPKDLSRVRLLWTTNYARSYDIQVSSNGAAWATVYSTTNGVGGVEDLLVSGRGRYVRLYGTERATGGGYSLREFQVYAQPQRPFGGTVHQLPGHIEAEDYDTGGEGVAYYDSSFTNEGGLYRSDDVDIETAVDTGGGYDVGWIYPGEWIEYTVNLPDASAVYNIHCRVSGFDVSRMRVRLDGGVLGTVNIPNTGGWQDWVTVTLTNVWIGGGPASRALRLEMVTANFNLNWFEFERMQICDTNNVAVDRPASASSVENSGYPPEDAFDGDLRTRWASAYSDPEWIIVDLGATQDITRVRLNWETAFSHSFSIDVSPDSNTWTTVYATTNAPGGMNDLGALATGRYVRMYSTTRATAWGNSLWQFDVYSSLAPSLDIDASGTNVLLAWPGSMAGWGLESTESLTPTTVWTAVSGTPVLFNSENLFTDVTAAVSQFYRLRKGP